VSQSDREPTVYSNFRALALSFGTLFVESKHTAPLSAELATLVKALNMYCFFAGNFLGFSRCPDHLSCSENTSSICLIWVPSDQRSKAAHIP
jgi:hypothetical protein